MDQRGLESSAFQSSTELLTGVNASLCGCSTCMGKGPSQIDGVLRAEAAEPAGAAAAFAPQGPAIAIGRTATGVLEPNETSDFFQINVEAGKSYLVGLNGSGPAPLTDPRVQVFDSTGDLIADNDDYGVGLNALVAFTAEFTGAYQIAARGFLSSGGYTVSVEPRTNPDVGGTRETAAALQAGVPVYDFLERGDADAYKITVNAGDVISFSAAGAGILRPDSQALGTSLPLTATLTDAAGRVLAVSNDDSGGTHLAGTSGTYHLNVRSADGGASAYQLAADVIDLEKVDPIDAVRAADLTPISKEITVYFAPGGQALNGETTQTWNAYEIQQAMLAFDQFERVADVRVRITDDPTDPTFKMVKFADGRDGTYSTSDGASKLTVFTVADLPGWEGRPGDGLERGGVAFSTIGHEIAHGFGIAHPWDGGVRPLIGTNRDPGPLGLFELNQGVFTVGSYNGGWRTHPDIGDDGRPPEGVAQDSLGGSDAIMALDIAFLQRTYGANRTFASGDDRYVLPSENTTGTGYQAIWDTGGTDIIVHSGPRGATIDLRAATLDYSPTGGGVVSLADGIFGGLTIANGVVIENASGGSGGDEIRGNAAANRLSGGAGDDTLVGGLGGDTLDGGVGRDRVSYAAETAAVTLNTSSGRHAGAAAGDRLIALEVFELTGFADRFSGGDSAETVLGGAGNDTLSGAKGGDRLDGGAGDDVLTGGQGGDTFAFTDAFGRDRVTDWRDGSDKLFFDVEGVDAFGDLRISAFETGVLITFGDSTVTIANITVGRMDASDFLFG